MITTSFVTCAAPRTRLVSSAAGIAVTAARDRSNRKKSAKPATTNSAANFSRLFAWIWWLRLASVAAGFAFGSEPSVPRSRPSAVGAMSTIDTSPGIRVVWETSSPWKPRPRTTIG